MGRGARTPIETLRDELPLLAATPDHWARVARADLETFLADHAVCEQQAALTALGLVGQYPDDPELVQRLSALAAEEVSHLRRVAALLRRRDWQPARRRPNPWVRALRQRMETDREPALKVDRLLVCALIEARSCERFTTLLAVIDDEEVAALLHDLGPAEKRHWELFHALAARELPRPSLDRRWARWLEIERDVSASFGREARVHG